MICGLPSTTRLVGRFWLKGLGIFMEFSLAIGGRVLVGELGSSIGLVGSGIEEEFLLFGLGGVLV